MKSFFYFTGLLYIALQSCSSPVDYEAEKNAILVLHNEQRQAHMEKNVSLLFKDSLTDYLEVNRGLIKKPAPADMKKRFQAYFDAVDFVKWDDANPPVFSFSDDATMATTVVDKLVITKDKHDNDRLDTFHYAWLAVYKKMDGTWRLHRMGSTSR